MCFIDVISEVEHHFCAELRGESRRCLMGMFDNHDHLDGVYQRCVDD